MLVKAGRGSTPLRSANKEEKAIRHRLRLESERIQKWIGARFLFLPPIGRLGEWLYQRFAKPPFRNRRTGSNPVPSAIQCTCGREIRCQSAKLFYVGLSPTGYSKKYLEDGCHFNQIVYNTIQWDCMVPPKNAISHVRPRTNPPSNALTVIWES